MTPLDLKRTCTTHHICDCKQAELEKLGEKLKTVRLANEYLQQQLDEARQKGEGAELEVERCCKGSCEKHVGGL